MSLVTVMTSQTAPNSKRDAKTKVIASMTTVENEEEKKKKNKSKKEEQEEDEDDEREVGVTTYQAGDKNRTKELRDLGNGMDRGRDRDEEIGCNGGGGGRGGGGIMDNGDINKGGGGGGGGGGVCCSDGRVWIFLVLGVLTVVFSAVLVGVYMNVRSLTSSLEHMEVLPSYIPAVAGGVAGLSVLLLFWKRNKLLVYLVLLLCFSAAVFCVITAVLTGTRVLQPLLSVQNCVYTRKTCQCVVDGKPPGSSPSSKTKDSSSLSMHDVAGCSVVKEILPNMLFTMVGIFGVIALVCCINGIIAILVCRIEHNRKKMQKLEYTDDYSGTPSSSNSECLLEQQTTMLVPPNPSTSHLQLQLQQQQNQKRAAPTTTTTTTTNTSIATNTLPASSGIPATNPQHGAILADIYTNTNAIDDCNYIDNHADDDDDEEEETTSSDAVYSPSDIPIEYAEACRMRRSKSFSHPVHRSSPRERSPASTASTSSAAPMSPRVGASGSVANVRVAENGGKLAPHRRKNRRAVTLHGLDRDQLMLILNLQMRYMQESDHDSKKPENFALNLTSNSTTDILMKQDNAGNSGIPVENTAESSLPMTTAKSHHDVHQLKDDVMNHVISGNLSMKGRSRSMRCVGSEPMYGHLPNTNNNPNAMTMMTNGQINTNNTDSECNQFLGNANFNDTPLSNGDSGQFLGNPNGANPTAFSQLQKRSMTPTPRQERLSSTRTSDDEWDFQPARMVRSHTPQPHHFKNNSGITNNYNNYNNDFNQQQPQFYGDQQLMYQQQHQQQQYIQQLKQQEQYRNLQQLQQRQIQERQHQELQKEKLFLEQQAAMIAQQQNVLQQQLQQEELQRQQQLQQQQQQQQQQLLLLQQQQHQQHVNERYQQIVQEQLLKQSNSSNNYASPLHSSSLSSSSSTTHQTADNNNCEIYDDDDDDDNDDDDDEPTLITIDLRDVTKTGPLIYENAPPPRKLSHQGSSIANSNSSLASSGFYGVSASPQPKSILQNRILPIQQAPLTQYPNTSQGQMVRQLSQSSNLSSCSGSIAMEINKALEGIGNIGATTNTIFEESRETIETTNTALEPIKITTKPKKKLSKKEKKELKEREKERERELKEREKELKEREKEMKEREKERKKEKPQEESTAINEQSKSSGLARSDSDVRKSGIIPDRWQTIMSGATGDETGPQTLWENVQKKITNETDNDNDNCQQSPPIPHQHLQQQNIENLPNLPSRQLANNPPSSSPQAKPSCLKNSNTNPNPNIIFPLTYDTTRSPQPQPYNINPQPEGRQPPIGIAANCSSNQKQLQPQMGVPIQSSTNQQQQQQQQHIPLPNHNNNNKSFLPIVSNSRATNSSCVDNNKPVLTTSPSKSHTIPSGPPIPPPKPPRLHNRKQPDSNAQPGQHHALRPKSYVNAVGGEAAQTNKEIKSTQQPIYGNIGANSSSINMSRPNQPSHPNNSMHPSSHTNNTTSRNFPSNNAPHTYSIPSLPQTQTQGMQPNQLNYTGDVYNAQPIRSQNEQSRDLTLAGNIPQSQLTHSGMGVPNSFHQAFPTPQLPATSPHQSRSHHPPSGPHHSMQTSLTSTDSGSSYTQQDHHHQQPLTNPSIPSLAICDTDLDDLPSPQPRLHPQRATPSPVMRCQSMSPPPYAPPPIYKSMECVAQNERSFSSSSTEPHNTSCSMSEPHNASFASSERSYTPPIQRDLQRGGRGQNSLKLSNERERPTSRRRQGQGHDQGHRAIGRQLSLGANPNHGYLPSSPPRQGVGPPSFQTYAKPSSNNFQTDLVKNNSNVTNKNNNNNNMLNNSTSSSSSRSSSASSSINSHQQNQNPHQDQQQHSQFVQQQHQQHHHDQQQQQQQQQQQSQEQPYMLMRRCQSVEDEGRASGLHRSGWMNSSGHKYNTVKHVDNALINNNSNFSNGDSSSSSSSKITKNNNKFLAYNKPRKDIPSKQFGSPQNLNLNSRPHDNNNTTNLIPSSKLIPGSPHPKKSMKSKTETASATERLFPPQPQKYNHHHQHQQHHHQQHQQQQPQPIPGYVNQNTRPSPQGETAANLSLAQQQGQNNVFDMDGANVQLPVGSRNGLNNNNNNGPLFIPEGESSDYAETVI